MAQPAELYPSGHSFKRKHKTISILISSARSRQSLTHPSFKHLSRKRGTPEMGWIAGGTDMSHTAGVPVWVSLGSGYCWVGEADSERQASGGRPHCGGRVVGLTRGLPAPVVRKAVTGQSDSLSCILFHVVLVPNLYRYFLSPNKSEANSALRWQNRQSSSLANQPGRSAGAKVEGGAAGRLQPRNDADKCQGLFRAVGRSQI